MRLGRVPALVCAALAITLTGACSSTSSGVAASKATASSSAGDNCTDTGSNQPPAAPPAAASQGQPSAGASGSSVGPGGLAQMMKGFGKTVKPIDDSTSTVLDTKGQRLVTCETSSVKVKTKKDVTFSTVTTRYGDKQHLKLDLLIPQGSGDKPLVVYIPGGGFHTPMKGGGATGVQTYLAQQGYAVASIVYRGLEDGIYSDAVVDAKSAIRFLRAHASGYGYDAANVAVWGQSAGGWLAAMVGTTNGVKKFDKGANLDQSSDVQAVVDEYGLSDLTKVAADFDEAAQKEHQTATITEAQFVNGKNSGKTIADDPAAAKAANPITYIDSKDPAFMLAQGSVDNIVSPSQTLLLHTALRKAGVSSNRYVIEGEGHGAAGFNTVLYVTKMVGFLNKHIGK
jgi:acetyl esterase/lipase